MSLNVEPPNMIQKLPTPFAVDLPWHVFISFLIRQNGGGDSRGNYPPIHQERVEYRIKRSLRATQYNGLAHMDIDALFFDKFGTAQFACSYKCGLEAPSNGRQLRAMLTGLSVPILEARYCNPNVPPEESTWDLTWLRQPLQNSHE